MSHIHWYPGHIAKAERALKEKLNLVDVILEVLDARIPKSSSYGDTKALFKDKPRIILLNKCDLSDDIENLKWKKYIEEKTGTVCLLTSNGRHKDTNLIINKILEVSKPVTEKMMQKGLLPRPIRTMVAGMPNVGKSSTINRLIKRAKTKTGARAGVTRQQQWVRVHDKIELLDTPGIIPMAQPNQDVALKLAFVNSIILSSTSWTFFSMPEIVAETSSIDADNCYITAETSHELLLALPTLEITPSKDVLSLPELSDIPPITSWSTPINLLIPFTSWPISSFVSTGIRTERSASFPSSFVIIS